MSDVCCWKWDLVFDPWILSFDHGSKRCKHFVHGHHEGGTVGFNQGSQLQVRQSAVMQGRLWVERADATPWKSECFYRPGKTRFAG